MLKSACQEIHSVENPVKTPPVDPSKTRDPSGSRRNRSGVRGTPPKTRHGTVKGAVGGPVVVGTCRGLVGDPSETRRGAVENPRTLEPHPTMLKNWVPDGFGQVPPDGRAGIVRCCSEMHQIYATDFAPAFQGRFRIRARVCNCLYIYIYIHMAYLCMKQPSTSIGNSSPGGADNNGRATDSEVAH